MGKNFYLSKKEVDGLKCYYQSPLFFRRAALIYSLSFADDLWPVAIQRNSATYSAEICEHKINQNHLTAGFTPINSNVLPKKERVDICVLEVNKTFLVCISCGIVCGCAGFPLCGIVEIADGWVCKIDVIVFGKFL